MGQVIKCTILDLADINKFISKWEGDQLELLRNYFVVSNCYILSSKDKSIYFLLEAKSKQSAVMHIYVAKESRGLKMFRFIKEVKEWGYNSTGFRYIFNYTDDHRVKLLMRKLGSKNIGEYKGYTVYKQVMKRRGN